MNPTSEILERVNKSSSEHHDGVFTRLFRYLLREDIYFAAYQKLYANSGAMTPGSDNDTADGFKIMQFLFKNDIIEQKPNGEIWAVCVPRLRHLSEVDIVNRYNAQIRGICNYYCLAANYDKLNYFRYLMEYSCLKTLASKSNSTTKRKTIFVWITAKMIS